MGIADIVKKVLPARAAASIARSRKTARRKRVLGLPAMTESEFTAILRDDLALATGDTVYVGSSTDQLNLDFPFYRILPLIQEVIGQKGNVMFPTYPNRSPVSSYQYLAEGRVFDIRRSPSFTGILSEFARRQKGSVRSLHPTKSVCAIGPDAFELTRTNSASPYPYDTGTPYHRLIEREAKIVGIGVWTEYLSFVYTVDDALKDSPPVRTYHPRVFEAKCINYKGDTEMIHTLAHDMAMVVHDVPGYMRQNIAADICRDLEIAGMKFFRAVARPLFDEMLRLARLGITVYPRRLYSKGFIETL